MRMNSLLKLENGLPITLLVMAAIMPFLLNAYYVHIIIYTLWFIYLCVTWNIPSMAGSDSLCHPLYISAGAYTSTLLFLKLGISPYFGLFAGVIIALLVALAIGYLCFPAKLPPFTFALITLALNLIVQHLVNSKYGFLAFLGGETGFHISFYSNQWQNGLFVSKLPYYYVILIMAAGMIILYRTIERSKLGLRFRAIQDNERASAAAGIDIVRHRFIALLISAGFSSLAGTFWSLYSTMVTPAFFLTPVLGIYLILFVYVGGRGTLWGAVLAPAVLVPLGEILLAYTPAELAGLNQLIYGVIVMFVILVMPRGVWGWIRERRARANAGSLPT